MKLRKIITMGLAAIMAVSAMSISAMATEIDESNPSYEIYSLTQEETRARGFEIIDEDIYDLNGNLLIDMTDGFTPDGYTLDPEFKVSTSSEADVIMPRSTNIANGTYTLNLNTTGEQRKDIGSTFKLTSDEPDVYVKYVSGSAASVNFGLVNIPRNSMVDWIPSVKPGRSGYLNGYASSDTWKLVASAQDRAGNARITAYTTNANN